MNLQRLILALTMALAAGCSTGRQTEDFGRSDQFTFVMEKKGGGHTQDFISRLRLDGGNGSSSSG